jgi:hypothetical protein
MDAPAPSAKSGEPFILVKLLTVVWSWISSLRSKLPDARLMVTTHPRYTWVMATVSKAYNRIPSRSEAWAMLMRAGRRRTKAGTETTTTKVSFVSRVNPLYAAMISILLLGLTVGFALGSKSTEPQPREKIALTEDARALWMSAMATRLVTREVIMNNDFAIAMNDIAQMDASPEGQTILALVYMQGVDTDRVTSFAAAPRP